MERGYRAMACSLNQCIMCFQKNRWTTRIFSLSTTMPFMTPRVLKILLHRSRIITANWRKSNPMILPLKKSMNRSDLIMFMNFYLLVTVSFDRVVIQQNSWFVFVLFLLFYFVMPADKNYSNDAEAKYTDKKNGVFM